MVHNDHLQMNGSNVSIHAVEYYSAMKGMSDFGGPVVDFTFQMQDAGSSRWGTGIHIYVKKAKTEQRQHCIWLNFENIHPKKKILKEMEE